MALELVDTLGKIFNIEVMIMQIEHAVNLIVWQYSNIACRNQHCMDLRILYLRSR